MMPYQSRHLRRIFLEPGACMAAQLFDAAVDRFVGEGFSTISAHQLAHSATRVDFDHQASRDVQPDHDLAVINRDSAVRERAVGLDPNELRGTCRKEPASGCRDATHHDPNPERIPIMNADDLSANLSTCSEADQARGLCRYPSLRASSDL
jgi:hypothetical protein